MVKLMKIDFGLLERFFCSDRNVICALVFGSSKDGDISANSDLDLGVLFRRPPKGIREFDYYCRVCQAVTFTDNVDMVVLNTANSILAFEIISARYICKNDREATAGFCSLVSRMYEDTMADINYQYSLRQRAGWARPAGKKNK